MQSCIHWCKIRFFQKECYKEFIIILEMLWSIFCLALRENQPGTACYSWDGQKEEQRCHIWPFQPHTHIFQLPFMLSSPQLLLLLLLWSLLNIENHEVHFAPKSPPWCTLWRSVQKILMWVITHLPHYSRFNWIQHPDSPGQLLISKAANQQIKQDIKVMFQTPRKKTTSWMITLPISAYLSK